MNKTSSELKPNQDAIDIKALSNIVRGRKWLLLVYVIIFLCLGFTYTQLRTPIYQSDMLIQVNNNPSTSQNTASSAANIIIFGQNSAAQSEANIIPSRGVLSVAAEQLNLDIVLHPKYFPIVGHLIAKHYARKHPNGQPAQPWLGMKQYSWGNDSIEVSQFTVPQRFIAQVFRIKILNDNAYQLFDPNNKLLATGNVGTTLSIALGKKQFLKLRIADIKSRKGVSFTIMRQHTLVTANYLARHLTVQSDRTSPSLLSLTYQNSSPERAAQILSKIGNSAITNQIEGQAKQASEILTFLHNQLPRVHKNLSQAEQKLNSYVQTNNGLDLPTESQNLMQTLSTLEQKIAVFNLQLAQLKIQYTSKSQQVRNLTSAIAELKHQRNNLIANLKKLPKAQQKQIDLMRNAQIQNATYSSLLKQIQQYQIMKAGTVGSLNVIDDADIPLKPINMSALIVCLFYAFLGFLLGLAYIIIEAYFILGMTSSEQIEEKFGLSLVASIHDCKIQTQQEQAEHSHLQFIAELDEHDLVAESFRSLFTYLQFELPTAKNNIIAIHGPTPDIGKSFISANLAYSMAQREKRVLLVDGDIRKGHLADYFGKKHDYGLVDILLDKAQLHDTIKQSRIENLDFLPCGHVERQFTELLTKSKMQTILEAASHEYDYVVVDTAPILTISDAMLIAPFVGTNLLVLCQGKHDQHEIQLTVDRFRKSKIPLQHFIFNRISAGHGYYGRYSNYYHNYYRTDSKRRGNRFAFWKKFGK